MSVVAKPPYRVPSMTEIAAVERSGLTVVSTFSGCGGSCLGFKMAGFRTLAAVEFVDAARETYAANFPGVPIEARDVRNVSAEDLLATAGATAGDVDVLEGSPPCASFSTAGKGACGWGRVRDYSDTKQRTDDLFFEFARLVDGVKPKMFVAENVAGLIRGVAKGYFKNIVAALEACGYVVAVKILDAQWLGVPQARRRCIFIGVRRDLGFAPTFPKPLNYRYSVGDALPWIERFRSSGGPNMWKSANQPYGTVVQSAVRTGDKGYFACNGIVKIKSIDGVGGFATGKRFDTNDPAPTVMAYGIAGAARHQVVITEEGDISRFAIGTESLKLRPGQKSDKYLNLVRAHPGRPSPTITATAGSASAAGVVHPIETRKFSIMELKRICGFPDDFVLTGTYAQQWERLGRAVPPPMMFHVAKAVAATLEGRS